MRKPRNMTVPAIHRENPVASPVFEKGYASLRKVKSTLESPGSFTFVDLYRDYKLAVYQKITTTFPETKILFDNSTKPEAPAPGLQKSHDPAPIVAAHRCNALQPPEVSEHKSTHTHRKEERKDKTKNNKK